jgi:hypothetical protein
MRVLLALAVIRWAFRWASRATSRRRMFNEVTWLVHVDEEVEAEE